ncbi:hypothetical protein ACFL0D_01885 [Thermoproteota archaeon]
MGVEKELKKTREAVMFKKFKDLWMKGWKEVQFMPIIMTNVARARMSIGVWVAIFVALYVVFILPYISKMIEEKNNIE